MIGIKHMSMPKCCDDCRFKEKGDAYDFYNFEQTYCGAIDIDLHKVKTSEERHPHCPLVEIRGEEGGRQ